MAACAYKQVFHRTDYDAAIEPAMKSMGYAKGDYEGGADYDGDGWYVAAFLLDQKDAEIERLRKILSAMQDALKARGLFAFEHIDGTYTINDL